MNAKKKARKWILPAMSALVLGGLASLAFAASSQARWSGEEGDWWCWGCEGGEPAEREIRLFLEWVGSDRHYED